MPANARPLAQQTAVITGSTSGIGLDIAYALAEQGANIVLNSFTDTPEDRALANAVATKHNVRCVYVSADMANSNACRALIAQATDACGACTILVNNAGIQHVSPIESFAVAEWDKIIAINLSAAFHTTAAALPIMRAQGWGRIINIASVHGFKASPYKSAYIAAKHGVIGLTKTVALETAQEPITINAICPGYVLTPLVEEQIPDQMRVHAMPREQVISDVMLARIPSKQFVATGDIAAMVIYLCSASSAQITGATLPIDGGCSAA